jgi:hypothetical protein
MLPPEELICRADQLADSLATPEGLSAFRKMVEFECDLARSAAGWNAAAANAARTGRTVGIWERESDASDAPFVRASNEDRSWFWADLEQIPPKTHRKRIAFIGESVARGFFYDPHISPAAVLESVLRHVADDDMEVIDLARIDLHMNDLMSLVESCPALQPDAVVIFAGNNWHPGGVLESIDLSRVAAALRQGKSWQFVKELIEERLCQGVRGLLGCLGAWIEKHGIPIVFLVPEFNLRDWRSEPGTPVILDDDALAEWLIMRERAESALNGGFHATACAAADQMIRLDHGTSPAGYNIRLQSAIECGGSFELRSLAENVRDAGIALTSHQTPRCYRVAQNVLLKEGPRRGLVVIDLPAKFEEYLEGELPGRRLFHDYCHLTIEGMRVAMACAALPLLSLLSGVEGKWNSLMETEIPVAAEVIAEAGFLAAVHNAMFGNCADMVTHQLKSAIAAHPAIIQTIRLYLDCYTRETPAPLCSSFADLARSGSRSILNLLLRSSLIKKVIHCGLVNQFARVLDEFGAEGSEYVTRLMISAHKLNDTPVNISSDLRHWAAPELGLHESSYAYHRSPARESKFVVVCDTPVEIEVNTTLRTQAAGAGEDIVIRVNGILIHTCPVTSEWSDVTFRVPENVLTRGMNEFEIVWPERGWAKRDRVARICEALDLGRIPECRPLFGEIHSFTVCTVRPRAGKATLIPSYGRERLTQ